MARGACGRGVGLAVGVMLLLPRTAQAYSYESPISDGCHERITQEALRRVRNEHNVPEIEPTAQQAALIADLPFQLDDDMRDLAAASLLIGVRDNDLKGRAPLEASELALIHGDPAGQAEHCLRRPEQDGEEGSRQALADCRSYIRESVMQAIHFGMDPDAQRPDPGQTTFLRVYLAFAGPQWPDLPLFYVYMGQALHTLQDSFTHAFRTHDRVGAPDGRRVTTILNWIDFAEDHHRERRDGPPHEAALDQCVDVDSFRDSRLTLATQASTELLGAALDPTTDAAAKEEAVDRVLDRWLQLEPGCDFDNRWCDAPERKYTDPTACSCRAVGAGRGAPPWLALGVAALLCLLVVRRRGRWRGLPALPVLVALLALPGAARAQESFQPGATFSEPLPEPPPPTDGPPPQMACVPGRVAECPCRGAVRGLQTCLDDGSGFGACRCAVFPGETDDGIPLGLAVAVGGAIDNTALAGSVGVRYAWAEEWILGADAEFNPWASFDTKRFSPGTMNFYATFVRRYPVNQNVTLRTTAHAGLSILLFDLFGAPAGSVGAYLGLSLIGVELSLAPGLILIVDPADVAYAVPHLSGAPLSYRQYRLTVGLQWGGTVRVGD